MSLFAPATRGRYFIAAIIAVFIIPRLASAQSEIKITGQVIDSISGNPIPGAMLWIEELGKYAVADNLGVFNFTNIPNGVFSISAARQGYRDSGKLRISIEGVAPENVIIAMVPAALEVAGQEVIARRHKELSITTTGNLTTIDCKPGALNSLADLVRHIPELEIVQSGRNQELRLRGSQTNAVIVMLDGRTQNSSLSATADLSRIPLSSVSKIEITKGGSYSAGGLAGSINFITEQPLMASGVTTSLERGSYGLIKYAGQIRTDASRNLDLGLDISNSSYRGDFKFTDSRDSTQTRENNQMDDLSLLASSSYSMAKSKLALKARWFNRSAGVPGPVFQATPQAKSKISEQDIYSVFTKDITRNTGISIIGGLTWRDSKYESPQTPQSFIPYNSEFREQARDIKAQFQSTGMVGFNAAFAMRHESLDGRDLIRPVSSFGKHSRDINSFGAGAVVHLPEIALLKKTSTMNVGLRKEGGDGGDFWGSSATLHFNFDLPLSPGMDIAYFRSRRLPDLTDIFWKEDVFATPNPSLKPEKSEGYEMGIDFHPGRHGPLDIRLSRYETRYDDIIIWRKWGGDKFKPLNLTQANISGWEAALSSRPFDGPVSLYWNANFMKPLNMEPDLIYHGKFLTYRPIETQNAGIMIEYHNGKAEFGSRHLGRRYQTEENTKSLPPVDLYDINLSYALNLRYLEMACSISALNITNEAYEILERQPEKPREYRIKIELTRGKGI